jgi:hypothetical protein
MGPTESSTRLVEAPAIGGAADWRARLRSAVYALYRERAELQIGAGFEELADLIDVGRGEPGAPPSLTRVTAEALGGAIFHEIGLAGARRGTLPPESELVPMLMYSAVLPYAGADSAAEELRIPPPPR